MSAKRCEYLGWDRAHNKGHAEVDKQPPVSKAAKKNRARRAKQKERRAKAEAIERGNMGVELLPKQREATQLRSAAPGEREYWESRERPPKISDVEIELMAYRERWATPDGAEKVATNALVRILLNDNATDRLKADVASRILRIGDSKLKAIQLEMVAKQLRMTEQADMPVTFENIASEGSVDEGFKKLIQSAATLEELDVIMALAERAYADVA